MPTEYRLTSSEALDEESTCLSILSLIRMRKKKQHTLYYKKKGIPMEQLGHFKILQLFTGLYLAKRKMFTSLAQHKGIK